MMGFPENHVNGYVFFLSKTEEITNAFLLHIKLFPRSDRMNNPVKLKINFYIGR